MLSVSPTHNPNPIFPSSQAADYGLVADVFKALPELEAALDAAGVKKATT